MYKPKLCCEFVKVILIPTLPRLKVHFLEISGVFKVELCLHALPDDMHTLADLLTALPATAPTRAAASCAARGAGEDEPRRMHAATEALAALPAKATAAAEAATVMLQMASALRMPPPVSATSPSDGQVPFRILLVCIDRDARRSAGLLARPTDSSATGQQARGARLPQREGAF